jgi:hypothetical protein
MLDSNKTSQITMTPWRDPGITFASLLRVLLLLGLFASMPNSAKASMGGFHECRDASGKVAIDLYSNSNKVRVLDEKELPYNFLSKLVITEKVSFCVSRKDQKRYEMHDRKYLMQISYEGSDNTILLCEDAFDSSPASAECDGEDVTKDFKLSGWTKVSSDAPLYEHNKSIMSLLVTGSSIRLAYKTPRPGMEKVGVRRGDTLFDGTIDGSAISGTARIFTPNCGVHTYDVSGSASADRSKIELVGFLPVLGEGCRVVGTKKDSLSFNRVDETDSR